MSVTVKLNCRLPASGFIPEDSGPFVGDPLFDLPHEKGVGADARDADAGNEQAGQCK